MMLDAILFALAVLLVANAVVSRWLRRHTGPARALAHAGRHAEAAEAYRVAYERMPKWAGSLRARALLLGALECYNAGRIEESLQWCREALALPLKGVFLATAHATAANALSTLHRLEEAEEEARKSLQAARALGDAARIGRGLAQLAAIQFKRGHLSAAMDTAREAERESDGSARIARIVQFECLRVQGRWDEARDALDRAMQAPALIAPYEARDQATMRFGLVTLAMEQGRPQEARDVLEGTRDALAQDEKLRVWWDAHAAWVAAAFGDRAQADSLCQAVEAALPAFAGDPGTGAMAISLMARTAFVLQDWTRSLALWDRYLATCPEDVLRVSCLFHRGECLRFLGETDAAREAFAEAAALPAPTHYGALSRERLKAMEAAAASTDQ